MEYPSKNDIFLKFKAIYNEKDKFIDYILIDNSENLLNIINYKYNPFLGKKISEIALDDQMDILGLKNLYYHMIPKTRRKFEVYNEILERWYIVNIFSDERDYLLMFYSDITRYKYENKNPPMESFNGYEKIAK